MRLIHAGIAVVLVLVTPAAVSGPYDAPANYYNSATGTGSTLESQLYDIMRTGHIQRNYGSFRFSAVIHDADPNNAGNILLGYNRASVSGTWDSGATWNREHVWPVSRQPGSASNSSTGNLGDPHALKPLNPGINSSRGNKPFGGTYGVGSNGSGLYGAVSGGYYYPGDQDAGDVARMLFYSDTRYGPVTGISLATGFPSGNEMGDLNALLAWHYLDTPDEFELRRNHTIYSQADNPSYYTNNRNAYVDRPEYVWSVFVDQQNDTQLQLQGGTQQSDGSSSVDLGLANIIVGGTLPASQSVTLSKTGNDGTYYSVTSSDASLTTDITGRYNAFAMGSSGSETINISISGDSNTVGALGGTITVDNLDVTTGAGSGQGAQDGDDTIIATMSVLDHANGSFDAGSDLNVQTIDLGNYALGGPTSPGETVTIHNLASGFGAGLTADLDLDNILESDTDNKFTLSGPLFTGLEANSSADLTVSATADQLGSYSAGYLLQLSDEDLDGAASQLLTLNVSFDVVGILGDLNGDGVITNTDIAPFVLALTDTNAYQAAFPTLDYDILGDFTGDRLLDNNDISAFVDLLTGGSGSPSIEAAILQSVPEPSSLALLVLGGLAVMRRRRAA